MKILPGFLAIFLVTTFLSCGPGDYDDEIYAKPIAQFLESESLKSRPHLKIKDEALGKEFMFYGTFIPMLNSPTGHSLKGRIIRFEIFADRVVMLESPKGHSIANPAESTILLAEFPIVQTEGDGVVIDFAKGMTSAFTTRNVHSKSVSDRGSGTSEQFKAIYLSASFVKSIKTENNVLSISQIAQWRNNKAELVSAEFRYFFRQYLPDANFVKKTFGKNRWVQYFSTPPQVEAPSTEPVAYIAKWAINKPIVFHLSANIPSEYRQAVSDGLLYWNHIFGQEIIKLKDLPAHLSAPHPRLNIIQWIEWANEASAYADMVVDHLTGETLQAQIYLRSGWVVKSARKLKAQLQEFLLSDLSDESISAIEEHVPMPSMFDYEEPCYKDFTEFDSLIDLIEALNQEDISTETLQMLTGDILRTVIAHEMGHVMGLRHNLASSTASNISINERALMLKNYLKDGKPPLGKDKYFSHSIMDVFSAADDALMGSQIRELLEEADLKNSSLPKLYRHDVQAIKYGYFDENMPGNTPFCTDQDIPLFLDCQRWDVSNTPMLYAASRLNAMPAKVASVLAETFIQSIHPERKGGPLTVFDVGVSNKKVLKTVETHLKSLFFWFHRKSRSAQIEAQHPAFASYNEDEIKAQRFKLVRQQLLDNGLNETLFALVPPYRLNSNSSESLANKFELNFLRNLLQLSKTHPDLNLSDESIDHLAQVAKAFFADLNNEIIITFASIVSRMQFDDIEYQFPIEESLGQIAREIILKNNQSGSFDKNSVPQFGYPNRTREAAATLLNPALGLIPDWSFENLSDITNQLKLLMRVYGASENSRGIDLNSLPRERRQWMLEQNKILNTLSRMRSMTRASE